MVASSTVLSIVIHLMSIGETSSPSAMSCHSRLANWGSWCLLAGGGLFRSSWTAAWVKECWRCLGDGGILRRFSAKLCLWLDLLMLDIDGDRRVALVADVVEPGLAALVEPASCDVLPSSGPREAESERSMAGGDGGLVEPERLGYFYRPGQELRGVQGLVASRQR